MASVLKLIKIEEIEKFSNEEIIKKSQDDGIENLNIKSFVFPTFEEALEYLEDVTNENKSYFVKYNQLAKNFDETEIYKELLEKLNTAKNNLEMFPESILDKLKQQKSGTKGCGVCKSTINKEYLVKNIEKCLETITSENIYNFSVEMKYQTLKCPICGDEEFIISETDKNKQSTLTNKIEEIEAKIKEREIAFNNKSEKITIGLIGYFGEEEN